MATIAGTLGNDSKVGTDGDDVVSLLAGNDRGYGRGGYDTLYGGSGSDTLLGGNGSDFLQGGAGHDALDGGSGSDTAGYADESVGVTIDLSSGTASTSTGSETLTSIENVRGSARDDSIIGDAGANVLWGLAGNDSIYSQFGEDRIYGGEGNDSIVAGSEFLSGGGVRVAGDAGNDTIMVEQGDYTASGGAGNDVLVGGGFGDYYGGPDGTLILGSGRDRIVLNGVEDSLVVNDFRRGEDAVELFGSIESYDSNGDGRLSDLDAAVIVSGGNLVIDMNLGLYYPAPRTFRDIGELRLGEDVFGTGFTGVQRFGTGTGETLAGGALNDLLVGQGGADRLRGDAADDQLEGGKGNDRLEGGSGNDHLFGGAGNDSLSGASEGDELSGGAGNDTLTGASEGDRLDGGYGNDTLDGGTGSDLLAGGHGNDVLVGGSESDSFRYSLSDYTLPYNDVGRDVIRDFARGPDTLELYLEYGGTELFDYLDTNDNNVLDDADAYVTLAGVADQGQTRTSTIIEMGRAHDDLPDSSGQFGANDVVVVFNVTGITANDFEAF